MRVNLSNSIKLWETNGHGELRADLNLLIIQ